MKHQSIELGDILNMKPERRKAYQHESGRVTVSGFSFRKGYKIPFITANEQWIDGDGTPHAVAFYRPEDFIGKA